MTRLQAGDLEASIDGGDLLTITSLRHRGEELLLDPRALPPAYRVHGRRAGITLLHPWANRLGDDAYTAAGVAARVPAGDPAVSRDPHGLAIHGLALADAWRVTTAASAEAQAVARFAEHPAFPYTHELSVAFTLDADSLTVITELRGAGERAVPVAFGWHPYFVLPHAERAAWRLELPPRRHLPFDARGLPDGPAREEPAEAQALGDRTFDDGYDGLSDDAVLGLSGGGRAIRIALLEGYPAAQVFAPPDADVVALEPMTAVTDALRTGRGLEATAPGRTARATFSVRVVDE